MPKGIIIWVMPKKCNVGHCRGITERFKSQIQHNSNYVVSFIGGSKLRHPQTPQSERVKTVISP